MIDPSARPCLAAKARLRFDRQSGKWLLLYPERGMELSASASEILRLCDGERTLAEIVEQLSARFEGAPPDILLRDVNAFLESMIERALVELKA